MPSRPPDHSRLNGLDHGLGQRLSVERVLHPVDARRVVEPTHVRVEAEESRTLRRAVAACALEDPPNPPVMHDVGPDMNLRVVPIHERAVHPDFAGAVEKAMSVILLCFAAKRAAPRLGGQRFSAVPAEAAGRNFTRAITAARGPDCLDAGTAVADLGSARAGSGSAR